ncbi:MAG: shikimate kinase [Candidatus Omnitrophica bacterium]|nr:shikimate kinase [Candidatus Omnitrophota bacterium]
MRNIILIGFMGTGKTTIATKVALRLKMRYVSTDDLIEKREKRTINEIFTASGEDYFREVESEVIRDVAGMEDAVIDAGGGAVMREENMANFKTNGIVICLTADEEVLFERVKKYKHRPLLNVEDPKFKIRSLMKQRAPFYAKADHVIDTGRLTIGQVIDKIVEITGSGTSEKKE